MRIRLKRNRLAQELARKSLSLNNWGSRLGLSKGHLSLLLNGRRRYPNPETRRKLMEGLSLRFEDLFELEGLLVVQPEESSKPRGETPMQSPQLAVEAKGAPDLTVLATEWKYALRALLRRPGLTLASVLTLALGIGAASVIFGVVEGVLLRPLPFDEPQRLALLGSIRQRDGSLGYASRPKFLDLRGLKDVFEEVGASEPWVTDWTGYPAWTKSASISRFWRQHSEPPWSACSSSTWFPPF